MQATQTASKGTQKGKYIIGGANPDGDELLRSKSGYQLKFHEELVKIDLQIQVVEMDVYVAPTVINLENPTFWISNLGDSTNKTQTVLQPV
jgi:hypothetical protein